MQADPIHTPATDIWEVPERIAYDLPLEDGDPRYVDFTASRGEFSFQKLLKTFGVDLQYRLHRNRERRKYALFCGHRGCGKSTELRRLADRLNRPELFTVVLLDVSADLDSNDISYADILYALAARLTATLEQRQAQIDRVHLSNLERWFGERIVEHSSIKEFDAEVKTEVKAALGIPYLAELTGLITTAFRTNSTHKEVLRIALKNAFTPFAKAFNGLLAAAEAAFGQRILFVVDGLDKLDGKDSAALFHKDSNQLLDIEGLHLYCANISLVHEGGGLHHVFPTVERLPMIKLADKSTDPTPPRPPANPLDFPGWGDLREFLHRRAAPSLFDPGVVDHLIAHCGGHPRELLRLLDYAFKAADERFTMESAKLAVRDLATEYQYLLTEPDYALLVDHDLRPFSNVTPDAEGRTLRLLFNLALLQYNNYWWQSHPAVRTLPGYKVARRAATA